MTSKNISVMDSAENTVTEPEEMRETWRQYTESVYDRDEKPKIEDLQIEEREEVDEDEIEPRVLNSDILLAISEIKEGKVAGVDEISTKMLKSLRVKGSQKLYDICKDMY